MTFTQYILLIRSYQTLWGRGRISCQKRKEKKREREKCEQGLLSRCHMGCTQGFQLWGALICRDGEGRQGTASHSLDIRRCTPSPALSSHSTALHLIILYHLIRIVIFLTNFAKDILKKQNRLSLSVFFFSSYPTRTPGDLHTKGLPVPRKVWPLNKSTHDSLAK